MVLQGYYVSIYFVRADLLVTIFVRVECEFLNTRHFPDVSLYLTLCMCIRVTITL